jgi:2,5-furandicarboxylate decarboxylase 1
VAWRDLRQFLEHLEARGDLLTISAPVDPLFELGAICRWFLDRGPNHALFFRQVAGHQMPVVANTLATRERLDWALQIGEVPRHRFVLDRWQSTVDPVRMSGSPPCQEEVWEGEEADLGRLPIPWHNVEDGGPYISMGILVVRDPESGVHNLSYARVQVKGARVGGIQILPEKHARRILERYQAAGQPMPVAIAIGVDPVLSLAAAASPPWGVSEYGLAGAWRGEPVEVAEARTVPVLVPAWAEIVIEGQIPPEAVEQEGPFGEFTGYYGPAGPRNRLEVQAITLRRDAIFQTLYTGLPICDNHIMQELLRSAKVWDKLRQSLPNITAVYCPPEAGNGFTVWIALKKRHEGEPRQAMLAAWTAFEYVKHVFVVDDDVDIYDARQREWAVATRVQADRDVLIVPRLIGMALDPSAQGQWGAPMRLGIEETPRTLKAGMGIDATRPLGVNYEPVVRVPESWMRHVAARLPELLGQNRPDG